ncbi:Apoptosis-inducing factor-like [Gracilariopsis chorda]|uniref:Apoptosis-inducing factor-like n=1 Tax=Gracilariopsis chorda TaxID=448386 RepID=A0A2V3J1C6_9FLOR|nr:Apoptosis-inducing factor-like [Gracilariopsis chorda]|eukprot:PXF47190.1 Apoptosis-inducing factor-like [Gracilariopsis chorda]
MHLLIIGGGLAGLAAAHTIHRSAAKDDTLTITVVEPKAYIEVPWATLRAFFDCRVSETCTMPMSNFLAKHPKVTHIRAKVTSLTKSEVTLDNGQKLSFDVCLLATGARKSLDILNAYVSASTSDSEEQALESRRDALAATGKNMFAASSILIIGGGAIGTELAADIAGFSAMQNGPKPSVTLVHSGNHLVPELRAKGATKVLNMVKDMGVKVHLQEKAIEKDGKWFLESSDQPIEADLVIKTTGVYPINDFMKVGLSHSLDDRGWVKVDDHFRVPGTEGRIFAVGDCCDALQKTGVNAMGSKTAVAKNIIKTLRALRQNMSPDFLTGLATKAEGPPVFLITVGPKKGLAQTPFGALTWPLPQLKNRTMFIFRAKMELGL